MDQKKTAKRRIGDIGEDIVVKFLAQKGFSIVERNFWKPFGEIDIICSKGGIIHFVEVKTVSRETGLMNFDEHRPEDNIHKAKLKRIGRTIQAYLFEQKSDQEWKFDVVTVELNVNEKTAKVKILLDIVL